MAAEPEHALATLGEVLLTPTRIYARGMLAARASLLAAGHDLRGIAHITGGGLPGNVPGRCRRAWARGWTRSAGGCRRSCGSSARWAGSATTRSGRRSTAGSGWSSSSPRRRSTRR